MTEAGRGSCLLLADGHSRQRRRADLVAQAPGFTLCGAGGSIHFRNHRHLKGATSLAFQESALNPGCVFTPTGMDVSAFRRHLRQPQTGVYRKVCSGP